MAGALVALGLLLTWRLIRSATRQRLRAAARRTVRRFELRLERYRLVSRRLVREQLLRDAAVLAAMDHHAAEHGLPLRRVRALVEQYVDEIVPFFDVLSYYRMGYNLARTALRLLYRVTSEYQDRAALDAIPRRDVVVYVMNHRSNADYVVVAFVLARGVSISYAVGEWARVWPLEYVFKSFGAYFVRRRFREPLYHTVLERYVQQITRNGVTQGIFLEGGLSRDGVLRPAKLGLLDYIARTLLDPEFDRDIWLVPVALNYDRVLEDRVLIRELTDAPTPGRLRQATGVVRYLAVNLARLVLGRLERYGRVVVNFGTPVSLRAWV
ncbi:MAG TPA: 1-acyl-sn-glycerol-3-phosphate acyltransferase, partial [Gemmatimonadales bacterium]|nr:1-acyl-sn-glycerol-3-phosphate acyltransferase [Gemmatimonadales bacterium]